MTDLIRMIFSSYANEEITTEYTISALLAGLGIALAICAVYYFKSRKYFFSREFSISLLALTLITTAIILTIQSNLAVSMGTVGALSIVRFRTAVKNPLDLTFLFWAISTGIMCGAGIYYIAIVLTFILGILVLLSDKLPVIVKNKLLVLDGKYPYDSRNLENCLKKYVRWWNIRTESVHNETVNLVIELRGVKDQEALIRDIRKLKGFSNVSVLVQEGAVD